MIRLASVDDAAELELLNAEFNGKGKTTEESIRASLLTNRREIVIAQEYCKKIYPLHSFELLTGSDNTAAQKLYSAIGFECDGEMHMSKQVK